MRRTLAIGLLASLAACGEKSDPSFSTADATTTTPPITAATTLPPTTSKTTPPLGPTATRAPRPRPTTTTAQVLPPAGRPDETVVVPYRIEVRSPDPALANFPDVVQSTLDDPRGWERARFALERREVAEYRVVVAEPDDAQALCRPYDVYRKYSCQNGPVVVINAERWRNATPEWTGDLATYRQMVVNHEFGHLLGQSHPDDDCPERGRPAAVMSQQSTELDGCLPNPWPLDHEIARAAQHDQPLGHPYGR